MNQPQKLPDLATLHRMMQGAEAAASVRANGGNPQHIDALAAPVTCEIAGVTLHCYPMATYCAMRQIHPWIQKLIEAAVRAHGVAVAAARERETPPPDFQLPVEVMLAQVFAFARPNAAYMRARNGEGDYLVAAFDWSVQTLPGSDASRWERLGKCYRFVLEQCGLMDAANPQEPETNQPPPAAPAKTAEWIPEPSQT